MWEKNMTKEQRTIYLWGLPFIVGDVWSDILISCYFHSDDPHNFGFWLDRTLTDEQFEELLSSNTKEKFVLDKYEQYVRRHENEELANSPDFKTYLSDRCQRVNVRWAVEKKANGGYTQLDHWALNPGEFDRFIGPRTERGEGIPSKEFFDKLRLRLQDKDGAD
jgi:hypothetical protein